MVGAAVIGGAVIGGVASHQAGKRAAGASRDASKAQIRASEEAAAETRAAAERAQGFFEPFAGAAQRGVDESGFLADPQAQFDFLQSNPVFNLALENANQRTEQSASANRRLSFGDTLQQLSNNVLLQSAPLIDRQREDVTNLLRFGGDIATSQANIETGQTARVGEFTTSAAAADAAGIVGSANARNAGTAGITQALQTGILGLSGGFGGGGVPINQQLANTSGIITPAG